MKRLLISLILLLAFSFLFFACAPGGITLRINPANSGTAQVVDSGNGSYTIIATANPDWRFDRWTGDYSGYINNYVITPSGPMTITANFVEYTIQEISYDFENQSLDGWALGGDVNPHIQGDYHAEIGSYAVQFGQVEPTAGTESVPLTHNQESFMSISNVTLSQGTTISFDYKVSSEASSYSNYDFLGLYIDNKLVGEGLEGEINWTTFEYEIPANGTYTLKWVYSKDGSQSHGLDCAWLDNIKMTTMPPVPKIQVSVAKDTTVTPKGKIGEPKILSYTIKNIGGADLHLAPVTITGTQFTITEQPDVLLTPGASTALKLSITPTAAGAHYQTKVTILSSDHENNPYSFNIDLVGVDTAPGWLFMMYMDGDNNLDSALWSDVNEMENGLYKLQQNGVSIDNIKILVLWDGSGSSDSKLYDLGPDSTVNTSVGSATQDVTSEKWWTGNEVNMGDGANVTQFLQWCENRYPGYTNRMFMVSDHGGGPGKKAAGLPDRAVCWDDSNGDDYLSTRELRESIEAAGFNESNKLSIAGQDVCMGGSIEEAYEHKNICEYFVASPESEQGDGWEFDHWLPKMVSDDEMPEQVATYIVQSYSENFSGSQTLTAVDLSQMDALKAAVDALATEIINAGAAAKSAAKTILNSTYDFSSNLRDIGEFCMDLNSTSNSNITAAIKAAATATGDALGSAIVWTWAGNSVDGGYGPGSGSSIRRGLAICNDDNTGYAAYSDMLFGTGAWANLISSW